MSSVNETEAAIARFSKKMTIGVLAPSVSDSRIHAVWLGLCTVAREYDISLLLFAAGMVHRDGVGSAIMSRHLGKLLDEQVLDGLITMQFWQSKTWFESYCRNVLSLPIVTIGRLFEGYSGVHSDTYAGVRSMVSHLVQDHGLRKFVFLEGMQGNDTHETRFRAFRDELEEHGILFPAEMLISYEAAKPTNGPGTEHVHRGTIAISHMIDVMGLVPGKDFDAVISISDLAALGVIQELQQRGYRVPLDVAVAGAENMDEGRSFLPPLSTVGIPWEDMGKQALRIMREQVRGAHKTQHVLLPSQVIFRRSCACLPEEINELGEQFQSVLPLFQERQIDVRERFISELELFDPSFAGGSGSWAGVLYDAFLQDVAGKNMTLAGASTFLPLFESMLMVRMRVYHEVDKVQSTVSFMRYLMNEILSTEALQLQRSETLWHKARMLIAAIANQSLLRQKSEQERVLASVQTIGQQLLNSSDIERLMAILCKELPGLGIKSAYLSLYVDNSDMAGQARLIMAYDTTGPITLPTGGLTFSATHVLPLQIRKPLSAVEMIIEPLYFSDTQLGIAVLEAGATTPHIYELLRGVISSALQGILLLQRLNRRSRELENVNAALRESVNSIVNYQGRLLESEQKAVIGSLILAITDDMKLSLEESIRGVARLDDQSNLFMDSLKVQTCSLEDVERFSRFSRNQLKDISVHLTKVETLTDSFRRMAGNQEQEHVQDFSLKSCLDDVHNSLMPRIRKTSHRLMVDCPEDLEIHGMPGAYEQIFTNLIAHSLDFSLQDVTHGTMIIAVSHEAAQLKISYVDNGTATSANVFSTGIDDGQWLQGCPDIDTTGLMIVHSLVTKTLGGTIKQECRPGHGNRHIISIPV